ncbi:MAG: peptidase [Frankiales bacterium]|nr:peptidase [Frankiales bacterium]
MTEVIVERDVLIPMRDGVAMQADIWRPADDARHPVLLQRTPYNRADSFAVIVNAGIEPLRAVADGFVVAISDTRGRFGSQGRFDPFRTEAADGFDTVQWLAEQPYSNGRIGMYGASYYGATQLLAATTRPPALKALAPQVTASDYHDNWIYRGGALQLGFALYWALGLAAAELVRRQRAGESLDAEAKELQQLLADPPQAFRTRPLTEVAVLRTLLPAWLDWLEHPGRDEFWREVSVAEHHPALELPALHIGGWFDLFLPGTLANFAGMSVIGAQQRLIIGPWAHAVYYDALGEVDYGGSAAMAALDLTRVQLDWFATHLSETSARQPEPAVSIFVMGDNVWRNEDAFPPARARTEQWYLHPGAAGAGRLNSETPGAEEGFSGFDYDPDDPVPTVGGATLLPGFYVGFNAGQRDQRAVEQRADVLSFTSAVLDAPLELCGPVSMILHAATDAADTDWTAKLVDVHPDGRALNVCDGIIRARYRAGGEQPEFVPPGTVTEFSIELGATSLVLAPGHALRVEISSSNFPRFDAHPNIAEPINSVSADAVVTAHQQIWHSAEHPSCLQLTTVPRS